MDSLIEHLKKACQSFGTHPTFWIAYSGGLDSAVLLHLASQLSGYHFRVLHVHHGLNKNADAWVAFSEAETNKLKLPFVCEHVNVLPLKAGESVEAKARQLRYLALEKHLQSGDVLLTAQHQSDQAETLLLQLTRGAGVDGLAAMPMTKAFGAGFLVRPLLNVTRDDLAAYAALHDIQFVHDDSNDDVTYTRNFLRHEVLPVLKSRWPGIEPVIARSAAHCAEAKLLLADLLQDKLQSVRHSEANALSISALNALTPALQKALIRAFISEAGFAKPSTKKINTVLDSILGSRWDKLACVDLGDMSLRRHRDALYRVPHLSPVSVNRLSWPLNEMLKIEGVGELSATLQTGRGLSPLLSALTVRFRQGGETIRLRGRGAQCLKNLFQSAGVLPWKRDRIPLLYDGEVLAAVLGYWIHEDYETAPTEMGWSLRVVM